MAHGLMARNVMIHPEKEKLLREAGVSDRLMAGLDDGVPAAVIRPDPVKSGQAWVPASIRSWRRARRDMVALRWDKAARRWVSSV